MNRNCSVLLFKCVALLAFSLVFTAAAEAKECKAHQRASCDALLNLSAADKAEAISVHLPYGVPSAPAGASNQFLLHQEESVINYDGDLLVPTWVAYRLRESDIQERERLDCFRPDPRISDPDMSATLDDYKEDNGVFDRGHMAPRAAMNRSMCAMINTYVLSNMTPQHDKFNRCTWRWLEQDVRDWAKLKGEIYVITGAVFDRNGDGVRDADADALRIETHRRVALPTHFFKIILHTRPNTFIDTMTFILPHDDSNPGFNDRQTFLQQHLASIADVEALTGIEFLSDLEMENPAKAQAVRNVTATELWATEEREPDGLDHICGL